MNIQKNYSLQYNNTFNIKAESKFFVEVKSKEEVEYAIDFSLSKNERILILGGGSNILFTKNFDGLIVKLVNSGITIIDENEKSISIEIQAGHLWDDVVNFAIENNYYGIENLAAIPGSVGAAPIQNIGAYGVELKSVVETINGYDLITRKWKTLKNNECNFGYRQSVFKERLKNNFMIYSVILRLSKEKKYNLAYGNLREYFNKNKNEISAKLIASVIRNIRSNKLPDPKILGNAGSFFKNPIISNQKYSDLKKEYYSIPNYPIGNELNKIPAGWLIENIGYKGKRVGSVGCYQKQSLIIVNHGSAIGKDVIAFAEEIKKEVLNKFNIELEYEVNIE